MSSKRVGIVGYGHLGQFLVDRILERDDLDLAFVWNRTRNVLEGKVEPSLICQNLEDFLKFSPDLVVEVAHPLITEKYGTLILSNCDYLVGSPTALANQEVESKLRSLETTHGLYISAGAFWGGEDIAKMADRGTLKALKVTMKKHPSSFKLESPLRERNEAVQMEEAILYDGPVRDLCPLAPNNVNTMAAAAIAAHNLGFDKVQGCLVSDPNLKEWHVVEIHVTGPDVRGKPFTVHTVRKNPADPGAVTGSATYGAFLSSLVRAGGRGPGIHLC